ncbi:uncharacterized protein LOC133914256 [Phragmites australis]|uniref:uncharacterized protein LOC133914256 n=1 Tax=Phragmites australis TaxID=29695 RepID=UPI002D76D202|nr:uncharacterized protein LOC133914256 [Phragmites australis]
MMQMEKLVNHCDMELMKMAMLKHEETFRQQVHELHRLYRVQKQLMTGPSCRRQRRKKPRRALDLHLPADEYIVIGADNATPPSREHELELTLAIGGGTNASRRKRPDEGTPLASHCSGGSPTSSSSSSIGTSGSPPYQFHLQDGTVMKQQQQAPWLVQYLSLRTA